MVAPVTVSSRDSIAPKTRTQRLRGRNFYHGMIARPDVDDLLVKNGDYLLRKTEASGPHKLALSVKWNEKVRHFMVQEAGKDVYFEDGGHRETDVEALVKWFERKKEPVTKQTGALLKRAVPREDWVLTHESIKLGKQIGAGQFGEVFRATFKQSAGKFDVAVKTLRDGEAIENQKSFLAEARLMRQLRHENVVRMFGVAIYERPLMIVMELCGGGSLLQRLRSQKNTEELKLRWVCQAARGLEYIASNGYIHRDIAARNCLLTDGTLTLKIADFGLTLKLKTNKQHQMDNLGKVPVKWLAKETLEAGIYSPYTDVWSFGVLCWEIYSKGAEPYTGMSNMQARAQILLSGYRMPMPEGTPEKVAQIIQKCWDGNPTARPRFNSIVEQLEEEGSLPGDR